MRQQIGRRLGAMAPGQFQQMIYVWRGASDFGVVADSGADPAIEHRVRELVRMVDPPGGLRPASSMCFLRAEPYTVIMHRIRGNAVDNRRDACRVLIGDRSVTASRAVALYYNALLPVGPGLLDYTGAPGAPRPVQPLDLGGVYDTRLPRRQLSPAEERVVVGALACWLRRQDTPMAVIYPTECLRPDAPTELRPAEAGPRIIATIVGILDRLAEGLDPAEAPHTFSTWEHAYAERSPRLPQIIFVPEGHSRGGEPSNRVEISVEQEVSGPEVDMARQLLGMWLDGADPFDLLLADKIAGRVLVLRGQLGAEPAPVERFDGVPTVMLGATDATVIFDAVPPANAAGSWELSEAEAADRDRAARLAERAIAAEADVQRRSAVDELGQLAHRDVPPWLLAAGVRQGLRSALRAGGDTPAGTPDRDPDPGLRELLRLGFPDFDAATLADPATHDLLVDRTMPIAVFEGILQRAEDLAALDAIAPTVGLRVIGMWKARRAPAGRKRRRWTPGQWLPVRRLRSRPLWLFTIGVLAASAWNALLIWLLATATG